MAFVGFAFMGPIATTATLDANRWRTVVYADTPRSLSRYKSFIGGEKKNDQRKAVLFLIGASNLHRVAKDLSLFSSVFVFDDLQNLDYLCDGIPGFDIVDVEQEADGVFTPAVLTPAEVAEVVGAAGAPPKPLPLLAKLTAALGKRKPSVLESTSRMPTPEVTPDSGAQRLLSEIKRVLDAQESALPFTVVLDNYAKFLFRILPRGKLTSQVTKKLSAEAKDLWSTAVDLANSEAGLRMAYAFRSLCVTDDPDYRVGHAVTKYGLKPYSGDFLYFTAILSPSSSFEFLDELSDDGENSLSGDRTFVPVEPVKKAKKKRSKKA